MPPTRDSTNAAGIVKEEEGGVEKTSVEEELEDVTQPPQRQYLAAPTCRALDQHKKPTHPLQLPLAIMHEGEFLTPNIGINDDIAILNVDANNSQLPPPPAYEGTQPPQAPPPTAVTMTVANNPRPTNPMLSSPTASTRSQPDATHLRQYGRSGHTSVPRSTNLLHSSGSQISIQYVESLEARLQALEHQQQVTAILNHNSSPARCPQINAFIARQRHRIKNWDFSMILCDNRLGDPNVNGHFDLNTWFVDFKCAAWTACKHGFVQVPEDAIRELGPTTVSLECWTWVSKHLYDATTFDDFHKLL
ncbi:hypothetical protein HK102_014102 [Quaeritorhiza haematococci]|nr:hypothetical protein HK102_014102 [Quaeritorhiza haematococci]